MFNLDLVFHITLEQPLPRSVMVFTKDRLAAEIAGSAWNAQEGSDRWDAYDPAAIDPVRFG
jgi:hypothetical protein